MAERLWLCPYCSYTWENIPGVVVTAHQLMVCGVVDDCPGVPVLGTWEPDVKKVAGTYEVWMEGWLATGGGSSASLLGSYQASSFLEACIQASDAHPGLGPFNETKLSIWGCRLFETEAEARRAFG